MIKKEYIKDQIFFYIISGAYITALIVFFISGFLPYYISCNTVPCSYWYSINGFLSMIRNLISYSCIIGLLFLLISNCFIVTLKIKIAEIFGIIGCILLGIYFTNLLIYFNINSLPRSNKISFFYKIEFSFIIGLIALSVIYGINIFLLIFNTINRKSEKIKMITKQNKKLDYKFGVVYLTTSIIFAFSCFFPYYSHYSIRFIYMLGTFKYHEFSVIGFEIITIGLGFPFGLIGLILIFISNIFVLKLKINKALILGIIGCTLLGFILIYLSIFLNNQTTPELFNKLNEHNIIEFGYTLGIIAWVLLCAFNISLLIFKEKMKIKEKL